MAVGVLTDETVLGFDHLIDPLDYLFLGVGQYAVGYPSPIQYGEVLDEVLIESRGTLDLWEVQ